MPFDARTGDDRKNAYLSGVWDAPWLCWVSRYCRKPFFRATDLVGVGTPRAFVFAALLACVLSLHPRSIYAQTETQDSELGASLQSGHAALKANDPAKAAAAFRSALKLDPGNADAHANLGVMAFFHGDCKAAEPEFQSALRTAPDLTNALALLSICERRLGQPAAQADMETAFANLKDQKLRTQVGVQLADFYFQQGDLNHTLPIIRALVDSDPDNVDLLFFAQRIYSEMADNTLNKLALLAPDSARMQQLIAERLINAGDLTGAIEHYRNAIAADPRLPGMHFELAEALMETSNNAETQAAASRELEAAMVTDGDSASVECALGRVAQLQAGSDAALPHYRRAYELNPNNVESQLGIAAALADQGKPEEALPYLRSAVQADPMNANAHYRLARVCHTLHLADEERQQMRLFEEMRATKDRIAQLYRQMNRRPDQPDAVPTDQKP
jgi:tetratricopeptide (TPR) repeat protein